MKQKTLLILAALAGFCAFAQENSTVAQDTPPQDDVIPAQDSPSDGGSSRSSTEHYITDELTGSKVFEGTPKGSAAKEQAAKAPSDLSGGTSDQNKTSKGSTQKPSGSTSSGKSSNKTTNATSKKTTTGSSGTKKSSATAGSAKKNTKKTGSTSKKSTATLGGKTGTKSGTAGGKKQTTSKTQSAPKPSEKPNQQTQNAGVSSETSLSQQETQQDQARESSSITSDMSDENLKTQQENQNPKTGSAEPVQSEGQAQNPSGTKSSTATATGTSILSTTAASSTPPDKASGASGKTQKQVGSDKTDDTAEHKAQPEKTVHFVSMKNSQYLDVTYPESGWIFLGEEGEKPLLRYFGRKIAGDVTSFSLRSRSEGKTVLHFYKNTDDGVIDDYIEVEIKGKNETQDRAKITPYSEQSSLPYPKDEPLSSAAPHTEERVNLSSSRVESADALLGEAKRLARVEDYGEALRVLDEFLDTGADNADEALFLQAQIFETSWDQKNIRGALDCYEAIVRRYPQSSLWEKANERAVYLKKFYFDIR